jgi:hypothetical protein
MAGKVLNINVCSPLKLSSGLTGKSPQFATTHTLVRWDLLENAILSKILNFFLEMEAA